MSWASTPPSPIKETLPEQALRRAAPIGIAIYFDNVGGDHLQAAINTMKPFGRIPLCSMISTYNAVTPPPGPIMPHSARWTPAA